MSFHYHAKDYLNEYEMKRLKNIQEGIKQIASDSGKVIEFGSNNGTITSILSDHFASVLAIDADPELLEKAKSNIHNPRIDWLKHDLNLPLPRELHGKYDAAVALEVIEHLDAPELFLEQVWLTLKRNGRLLISTPNLFSPEGVTGTLRAWKNGKKYMAWDNSHKNLFISGRLIDLLKRKGFNPIRVVGYHYDTCELPLIKRKLRMPFHVASWFPLNRLGFNIMVEAIRVDTIGA